MRVTGRAHGIHQQESTPMGQTTVLSTGKITASDSLTVELVEPSDMPPTIRMRWPTQPSITEPYRFSQDGKRDHGHHGRCYRPACHHPGIRHLTGTGRGLAFTARPSLGRFALFR